MRTLRGLLADRLRNSFWFTPALMTFAAILLATLTLSLDEKFALDGSGSGQTWVRSILYSGDPDGARQVLATIAGSMVTVAGVIFSITMVALTLTSQQFGTRLLANYMRDRVNHVTLGTFIAAFVYSLLVMRRVYGQDEHDVPHLSVTVALVLAVASVSVLIVFIHHVSVTIQAPNLVRSIGREVDVMVRKVYPLDAGDPAEDPVDGLHVDDEDGVEVAAGISGYVELVDLDSLLMLATDHDLRISVDTRPGRFIVPTSPFARIWPARAVDDEVRRKAARAVGTGARRTPQQDLEFPMRQLTEMAVRALSPAVNDPFTAVMCVDQLSVGLCDVARRPMPRPVRRDETGRLRVWEAEPVTFERLVSASYDQIRQCASFHVPVYVHALDALATIAGCVRETSRLDPLRRQGDLLLEAARRNVPCETDLGSVEERHDELLRALDTRSVPATSQSLSG